MPQILQDGTLVHECYLCHQYKPIQMMEKHGLFYVCRDCDEHEPMMSKENTNNQPAIIITPKLLLPSVVNFNTFMDDILFYKCNVESSLTDHILTLTADKTKKSIQLNIDALLQILCDKSEHPAIHESLTESTPVDLQIKLQRLQTEIENRLEHAILKYNHIMAFDDKRVKELCQSYTAMISIKLSLRLEYMEWEKTLIDGYIQGQIQKGLDDDRKRVSEIQQDYAKKLDEAKIDFNLKTERSANLSRTQKQKLEELHNVYSSMVNELATVSKDKDEFYEKYKSLENVAAEQGLKISKLEMQNTEMQNKLKKPEKQSWKMIMGCTKETPTYYNKNTKESVSFPCSTDEFKTKYTFKSADDDSVLYQEIDGDKIFSVPESLEEVISSELQPKDPNISEQSTKKPIKDEMDVLTAKTKEVLKCIPFAENEDIPLETAISRKELAKIANVDETNLSSTYLKTLVKHAFIEKIYDPTDRVEKYYRIK